MTASLIARSLKSYRQREGLTQDALARRVGVVWVTISRWENSRAVPQHYLLQRLQDMGILRAKG